MKTPPYGLIFTFLITLTVYALSSAPGIFGWDSAELTLGVYTQGIVHATGYPLYLMLARLFTMIPLPFNFAVMVNLFSAFCGALTAALLFQVIRETLDRLEFPASMARYQGAVAAGSVLIFAFAQDIWGLAVVAEVYMLHTALMGAVLLLLFRWWKSPTLRLTYAIALLFGLALAHHMAALLVAVVVLPVLLLRLRDWRVWVGVPLIVGVVAGALYLYIPVRSAAQPAFDLVRAYFDRDLTQPIDLLWMVSGQMFGREMLAYPLDRWLGEIGTFAVELWVNGLGVWLLVGAAGGLIFVRRQQRIALVLMAIFAAQVLFFTSYNVFDKWKMFHTAYLVWAIFAAVGFMEIVRRFSARPILAFMAILVVAQVASNWGTTGRYGDTFIIDRSQAILANLPQNATLIGSWTMLRPLEYFQIVQGQREDIRLHDTTLQVLGTRDRLPANRSGDTAVTMLNQRVYAQVRAWIDCAPAAVYVSDLSILIGDEYNVIPAFADVFAVRRRSGVRAVSCDGAAG